MSDDLQLQFEQSDKIHVVTVRNTPRLDQSNHEIFGQGLVSFLEENPGAHLLISLEGIEFISSAALSEMIQAMRIAGRDGGKVRVCGVTEYVASVFEVTRLDKTFGLGGPVPEAAKQFNADLLSVAT